MPHDGWHPHDHDEHGNHPLPRRMVLAAASFPPFGGASAQAADAAERVADDAEVSHTTPLAAASRCWVCMFLDL